MVNKEYMIYPLGQIMRNKINLSETDNTAFINEYPFNNQI